MAGFYDKNGNKIQDNTSSKSKKISKPSMSHLHIDNVNTKNKLVYDGKELGTITNAGLKAIESGTLGSYTPATEEERKAIEAYRIEKAKRNPYNQNLPSAYSMQKKSEERTSALLGADDKMAEMFPISLPSAPSADNKTESGGLKIYANDIKPTLTGEQFGAISYDNAIKRYGIKENEFDINAFDSWARKNNFEPVTNDNGFVTSYKAKENTSEQAKKDYQLLWNLATTNSKAKAEDAKNSTAEESQPPKPKNTLLGNIGGVILSVPYAVEKAGAGAINAVEGVGDFLLASGARIIGSDMFGDVFFIPDSVSEKIRNYGSSVLESENLGEKWSKNIENRYAVHDWTRANVGTAFEGAGNLLPALATEIYTAGASPMGDMWLAKYIFGKAPKLATTASKAGKVANTVTKVVSPSEIIFGLGVAGQSASEGYRTSGDLSKSLDYGAVSGTLEVAIERLFGGIAGTKYGKSILNYTTKSKPLSVVLGTGGEIFEELTSTFVDTPLRRLTVDEDAEWADFKDYYESGKQAIYLSLILGVGTYPFKNKQRKDAIQTLNVVTEELKKVAVDKSKIPSPLPENASIEDVQQRQKDLQEIARAYANQVVAETEAKENAMHNAPQSSTTANPQAEADTNSVVVGDTFKANNASTTSTDTTPVEQTSNEAPTTPIATSDNVPVATPTITETQAVPTQAVESAQPTPVTAQTETKGVTTAYTNNNEKIDLKYKVVSLDDLIVSNNADGTINPKYPQYLQPRERTRQASILQVQNIASNLVPEKLGESTNVSDGSPIVGSDNVVESGNGRTMALSLVYKNNPENAKKYIEFIKANAEKFGIDATNLPKNPVLVRERLTDVDRVEFVKQANESNLSAMSATELAKSDAERLSGNVLDLLVPNDDGNLNTKDNQAFVGRVISEVFSQNDLNSVVGANGMLSANGLERIRNAMFYKAYGNTELASKLSESLDNDIKNITNVLVNIAPKIVAIKNGIANGNYYDLDFSQDIVDAINYLQEAKRQNLKIRDFVNQLTIGDDVSDISKAIAYLFEQKNRGAKQATLFFNHLCDIIMSKNPNQLGFLNEDVKTPTKEKVLYDAAKQYNSDEESTGIEFPESFISQRSEELSQVNDGGGIGDNIEGVAESRPVDREGDGVGEQHKPVEEETALTGDIGTPRQSEGGTEERRPANRTDEAEVGAGELSYDDFTLDKVKHTATNEDIWVIRPKERVDNFNELKEKMRSLGGYYSRFATTPNGKGGFVFKENPSHLFGNTQNASNSIETAINQTPKTNKEEENNGRGEEIPDTSNAEGGGGVAEKDSRGTGSDPERIQGKIKEILLPSSADKSNKGDNKTGRVEQQETSEDFEERALSEGYNYVRLDETSLAFKLSDENEWNENAKEAAEVLKSLGFSVAVFKRDLLANNDGVSEVYSQGATIGSKDYVTIFVSDNLEIDGMEFAYHEAFHALRKTGAKKNADYRNKIINAISNGVNVESGAFEEFVSAIAELYSYNVKKESNEGELNKVTEEFYAWYIGSIYANKNGHEVDMLTFVERFSDVDSTKTQISAIYEQIKSEATEETPTQNAQNKPKTSENVSGKQTPAETENVATTQNTSDTEVKENTGNGTQKPKVLDKESGDDDGGLQHTPLHADGREGTEGISEDSGQTSREVLPSDTVNGGRSESDVGNDSEGTHRTDDNGSSGQEGERADGGRSGLRTAERTGLGADGRIPGLDTELVEEAPEVIETVDKAVEKSRPSNKENFTITNDVAEELDNNLPSASDNIEAIELLLKIESEGRPATADEKTILAKYKGWGGIDIRRIDWELSRRLNELYDYDQRRSMQDSGLNAFFTPTKVIDAMYNGLKVMGFKGGNILETSMGTGNFFGRMPKNILSKSALTGIELESYAARIAQMLYPGATVINKPFQDVVIKNGSYDLVIGNVPFGNEKLSYNGKKYSLHNYFIISSLDKVRDGGVVAVITSAGTLDNYDISARSAIMDRADVVACYKLPAGVFSRNAKTDVQSDLLILRKRASGAKPVGDSILNVTEKDGMRLNEYFVKHPENILGTLSKGTNAWGEITTVLNNGKFDEMLTEAMNKLPKNIMSGENELKSVDTIVTTESKPRFFEKDGKIYADNGAGEAVALTRNVDTARDYIAVRDAYKAMLDAYNQNLPEAEIKPLRETLNKAYDNFYSKHSAISGDGKKKIGEIKCRDNTFLEADADYYLLCGLERYDKKAKKFEKSALFDKDTLRKKTITSVETSSEALAIALNETGGIDFKRMSELTGKTEKELAEELKGEIVYTPQGKYELLDIYLSGDIYAKLEEVKGKPEFKEQEEMLKKVLPTPKDASQITVKLGANYIDASYIEDFASEIFNELITVKKNSTGNWVIEGAERGRYSAIVNSKYGCASLNAVQLLQRILNDADIVCNKTVQQGDKKVSVFDKEMTDIALGKAQDIRDAFDQWIFKDARRRNDIVDKYNRTYNAVRPLDYEHIASKLTFNDMNPTLRARLYPHQRKGIARFLFGGNTLFAHGVGTGKTFEMIASVMEAKGMGIVNKTAMVVPNNKVVDFKRDILEAYPNAKVLVIDTANKKRQTMLGLVNSNDWDIILIARTTFTKIPVSAEMQKNFYNSQLEALEREIAEAQGDRNVSKRQINGLITQRKNLEEKLKDLDKETNRDAGVDFDKLGIDCICVDEAHNYKSITTPSKLQIKGLVNKNDAQQANDMLMKLDYLRSIDGKIVFGTGTPITNTVSEIYNMIRMVRPDILENADIHSLDEWVNTFAKIESNFEQDIDGTIKTKPTKTIRSFINSKEMVAMFRQFADIVFTQDVVKNLPKAIHHSIEIKGTKEHKLIKNAVNAALSSAKGTERLGKYGSASGMLNASAVDLRMLAGVDKEDNPFKDYTAEELDFEDSKINTMCGYILQHYKESQDIKGTQIIFCDGGAGSGKTYTFNIHKDIKQKLIEQGIPEAEIVVVKDQNEAKLEELYAQVNSGEVRVLIGTSAKMAEGLNVQERVVAIHHPTVSYKPSDLEQSDARGVRSGNINSEVHIYRYLQGDTFDSHKWQAIDRKSEMIRNALKGEDVGELEDIGADEEGGADIDPATAMAITSGNPLIKAKIDIDKKVASLMNVKKNYQSNIYHYQDILAKYPTEISQYKTLIGKIQNDIALRDKYGDKTHIVIKGNTYEKPGEANKALIEAIKTTAKNGTYIKIGEYNGFDIMFKGETGGIDYSLKLKGSSEYFTEYVASGNTMARFAGILNRLDKDVERYQALIEQKSKDLETARQEVNKPFERENELEEALAEQKKITYDYEHYDEVKAKYEGETTTDDDSDDDSYDMASTNDRWKTGNAEHGKNKGDVSLNRIVKKIRNKFGIPIATGKVSSKDARGVYKRKAEVIRTRIANNLPTISHELGHHLDKLYSFSDMGSVEKLMEALPQEFLSLYSADKQASEAVAEFVRTYLKSKTEAKQLSEDFYNDFVNALSKKDLRIVNDLADDFNHYLSMELDKKYQSAIVSSKPTLVEKARDIHEGGIKGVADTVGDKAHDTYTKWIDSFHPIKEAVDFVKKSEGKTIDGKDNAYTLATNSLNAATIASYIVNDGFRDLNGNILEEMSFNECIRDVKAKDLNILSEYLVLKHSLELINQDMRVFADDTLEDVDTIKGKIQEIERNHPEMIEASENLYEYQRNMLKYWLVDSGLLSEEGFNAMIEKYPCYVPFYRDVSNRQGKAKGTFANQTTPIKRIKGSGASIINPLESIINNTEKFVKAATRNQVMQVLTNYTKEAEGFGQFIEKVTPDMIPHMIDITKQKEKFTERLQQTVNVVDYFNVTNLLDEVLNDTVMDFTPMANASKKLVTVMVNGRASYYQVHDNALYDAIAEMTMPRLEGALNVISKIMLPMKTLMTQVNPLFASSNFFRDYGTAYKHSQINNPVAFAVRYMGALKSIIAKDEMYQQYKAMGGGHSSKLASDINQIKKALHDIDLKDKGVARRFAYAVFRHPIETITSINDIVESIPRVLEFTKTLQETGDLQQAIFNADDITTNFKRHGSGATAKLTNQLVFFNNASLQGLDKTRRSLTGEDAVKKWTKWALFALLASALQYYWNRREDEEGYEQLSSYTKNNFYVYAIGDGKFVAIPKPRETAMLDSFTERTIEYVFGNKDAFYDFGGYLADNLLPPMVAEDVFTGDFVSGLHDIAGSTVFGGLSDIGFNKDFLDRPIESNYEQDYLESWERWDGGTSKLAYNIGQTEWARNNDMSPKKIDHLLSSYLGIIGSAIQAVFPMDETRKDVTLGLRNRFIKDSVYSTDVINKLWDNTKKAEAQFKFDSTIDNAIEYEQNAIITNFISQMHNAIYALPLENQRDAKKLLLKELNQWDYELTTSQQQMKTSLADRDIDSNILLHTLPKSLYEWTEDKQKYSYQMTPEEYISFVKNYLKEIEKYRAWCKKTYTDQNDYIDNLSKANGVVMKYMRTYYNKAYKSKATKE